MSWCGWGVWVGGRGEARSRRGRRCGGCGGVCEFGGIWRWSAGGRRGLRGFGICEWSLCEQWEGGVVGGEGLDQEGVFVKA